MKKFLKIFLLVPIFLFSVLINFACGEESIKSITLSLSDYQVVAGYYNVKMTSSNIGISVKIEPNTISASDLTWESSATDVVTVYNATLKTRGAGTATITASYKNNDGSVVKGTLRIRVNPSSEELSFSADKYETQYTGESLINNYKVIQDNGTTQNYTYTYFNADIKQTVEDIVDVGTYQITCTKTEGGKNESCSTILIVKKANLNIYCGSYKITYGDDLPTAIYSKTSLPEGSILANDQVGTSLYGFGKDSQEKIGEYIQVTDAYKGSNVKSYKITAYFEIEESFQKNYDVSTANITEGSLTVLQKDVVLVVNNQTITYGNDIEGNKFSLYSYKEYTEAGHDISNLTPLDETVINFSKNIYLGSATFMLNGSEATKNDVGNLNVLIDTENNKYASYDLCYNNATTVNSNLYISAKLNGKLTIIPREVTILPVEGQIKVYGDEDPSSLKYSVTAGTFINQDNLPNFLQVDYGEGNFGQGNFLAGVNKYFYKINNELNTNYKVSLGTLAQEGNTDEDNKNKIKFEVVKSEIVIKLNDLNENYKTPQNSSEGVHSISYYDYLQDGTTVPNYIARPESITVNGQEILSNTRGDINQNTLSEDFEKNGLIILKTGGTYKFSVSLIKQTISNYYMSYKTDLSSNFFEADENNFIVTFISSNLNLRKLNITIIPKMTTSLVSYEYDGIDIKNSLPTGFMSDYRVSGELNGNEIEQILVNYTEVLSLVNESGNYTRVDSNSVVNNNTSTVKNVGRYQIYLSKRLIFKEDMEYYNISLDTSTTYYFTITKATALITPQINNDGSNQSKIYGDNDPENLKYDYYGVANDDTENFSGKLSRVSGENVGDYEITLGNLSLGENYNLLLSSTTVCFSIIQREIKIEPISYVTTFGENYPTTIDYYTTIVGEYDDSILIAPIFTGELEVKNAVKINGYYPVCVDESGNVLSYLIGKGTLACNDNYIMTFIEGSTYKINKRTCVIDITSQQVENKNGLTTTGLILGSSYYAISNLLSGTTSTLTVDLEDKESFLDVKNYYVSFYMGGTDISYCYEESLGQKIVYNIDVKIIYLTIVDSVGKLSSTVNVTYNGDERDNDFTLVCQTEGYIVDEQASSYSFSYLMGNASSVPKDVGSYVVSIDLSKTGSKIVLKHNCISGVCDEDCSITESIEFLKIDGEVKQNCVLSVSNYGYLNISRANIGYLEDKLSFKSPLTYGTDVLSDINTSYTNAEGGQVPIFYGVGNDSIDLLKVNSKNYYYSSSNYSLSLLDANKTYPIELTVQAAKNGNLDKNYNPLTISVPLQVVPKNLFVNSYQFNIGSGADLVTLPDYITYDGISRPVTITLDISNQNLTDKKYATTYNFIKLKSVYADSVSATVECYGYKEDSQTGVGYPAIEEGLLTKPLSEINSGTIDKFIYLTYDGIQYLVINNYCLLLEQNNVGSPLKAGIYVCVANCEAKTNYIFAENESNPVVTGTSRTYVKMYEIKKSSDVSIDNWKGSFYYTTQFDLNNPELLPFEYDMSPNFKDQVLYTMEEPIEWPSNNMLSVGNYSVTLTVVNDNYYYSNPFTFEVTKLAAEFVFPTTKTYVYKGENIGIVDFLNNIRILEKDKDGNTINSFYYTYDEYGEENPLITLEFYEPFNETALSYIPWNVLENEDDYYTLKAKYGGETSNYYGEGEFKYKIIKKAYMGAVRFQNTTIIYNPSYTAEELYTLIYANMFSIGLEDGFTASIFNENTTDSDNALITAESDGWVSNLLREGQKTLRLEVEFSDGITADYKATAILTIQKMSVSQTEIVAPQGSTFTYNGYPVYNYLNFNTASLNPEALEVNVSESLIEQTESDKKPYYLQYTSGRYIYTVFKTKEEGNTVELKVKDNLGNIIFTVVYTYQYEDETGAFVDLREINGSTSVSNPNYIYHLPIDPKDTNYRVVYTYTFGDNYTGSAITLTYKNFKINKIPTLYISFDYTQNSDWSNWDLSYNSSKTLSSRFDKNLLVVKNQSGGSNVSNVKLNVQLDSYNAYHLQRRSGIHLFVYFTNYKDEKLYNIYDANNADINGKNYYMHATIIFARYDNGPNEEGSGSRPYYLISDYVDKVKFGSNPEILATYFNPTYTNSELGIDNPTSINKSRSYSPCLTQNVVISKYLYNIDNWEEVLGSGNNTISTIVTKDGSTLLKITKDSVVTNLTQNVIKIKIKENKGGEDQATGYEITSSGFSFAQFVSTAGDYKTTNKVYRLYLVFLRTRLINGELKTAEEEKEGNNYTSIPISFIVEKETE